MRLNIPAQNAPTSSSSPSSPRKLKKVLAELPNANMGELTKQTYHILRDQNRQTMANKSRLENLEMLRVLSREIFNSLKKYFINRTLPLPEKSKKIVNLNQAILQELIYGYEIIAFEAANKIDTSIDDKTLSTAICRTLNYLAEMLLRASEVYQPYPKNLWHDAHQLYLLAEKKNLSNNDIFDNETDTKITVANSYKRILLFALARPISLRQSDCGRAFKELYEWSQYADIQLEPSADQINRVFCMKISEDKAPDYLSEKDLAGTALMRTLDTSKLIAHIEELIAEKNKQKKKLVVGEAMPLETLITLKNSWGENSERRFSRAERHGHINVAIGLTKICDAIRESKKIQEAPLEPDNSYFQASSKSDDISSNSAHDFFKPAETEHNLTLETIADDQQQEFAATSDHEESCWDMVAKGRILTEAYETERKKSINKQEQVELRNKNADSHWEIVNISAGGYCLRWNSDDTSRAQIGELIALQEFDQNNNFTWHIGAIRWMQFTQESGLEIGVQILSPKVEAATAQRANRLDETPFDCLMLPAIKTIDQSASALLPAHAFSTDNKLVVKILDNIISVTLGESKQHTGSFTQFTYSSSEIDKRLKKQIKKEQAIKNKDNFDELWLSL